MQTSKRQAKSSEKLEDRDREDEVTELLDRLGVDPQNSSSFAK